MDYDNIQVIDCASSNFRLRITYSINEQQELNKQLNSQSDNEIKTLIIQAYLQHRKKCMRLYSYIY
jgi:hypothetical protein